MPALFAVALSLVFLGGSLLQSRAEPAPPPEPEDIFANEPVEAAAGCTFDIDLPELPEHDDAARQWVDCERLLPRLEVSWAPPVRTHSRR